MTQHIDNVATRKEVKCRVLVSNSSSSLSESFSGFNQGVRMFCAKIGQIMGPLWAASLMNNLTLMASVNAGLLLLLLVGWDM